MTFVEESSTFTKPKVSKSVQKELEKAEEQFNEFDAQVKGMTLDRMNTAPPLEQEQQTKLSNREVQNSKEIYLKPIRYISDKAKFNEKFREDYNFMKEYVCFIAEHKELQGETIEMWTKKFPGVPAEEWHVPVNKPVWGPRYLAEQIRSRKHHRLSMAESVESGNFVGNSGVGAMYGKMVVDNTVQRMDAYPAATKRSIFT